MLKILILITLVINFQINVSNAQNYCAANFCRNGVKHIACGHKGNFAAICPKNARMISLVQLKTNILNIHNSRRNLIASGKLAGYQPAAKMATMQWDNELAKMAALNVKQCQMKHDQCRNTLKFSKSGQNLAMISYTGTANKKSNLELIRNRVNAWWNEYKNANMNYIRQYPKNYSGPAIGHFTVFVADRNVRVGCAAIRFTKGKFNSFLIACNYATTNIVGQQIYEAGTTGKNCRTGRHATYTSLCSVNEIYTGL